jgi:hypothetical protein
MTKKMTQHRRTAIHRQMVIEKFTRCRRLVLIASKFGCGYLALRNRRNPVDNSMKIFDQDNIQCGVST